MGRIERAKERKERGEGRGQVCLLFLTSRGTLASCPHQEETRDKKAQLQLLDLVHWQASWPLSTPSGQDVSLSEE